MMGWYGYMGGMAWYGWLMMLVFLAAVIVGGLWVVRALVPGSSGGAESADEILSRRFAKGELSRDEYEQARTAIHAAKSQAGEAYTMLMGTGPAAGRPAQVVPVRFGVGRGRRIRFEIADTSMMPHPRHVHGQVFQVNNGAGRRPAKDTELVQPMQQLAIDWIANNPGNWAFHGHNAYHAETGMMRVVRGG